MRSGCRVVCTARPTCCLQAGTKYKQRTTARRSAVSELELEWWLATEQLVPADKFEERSLCLLG
jgi:hypothetical protein